MASDIGLGSTMAHEPVPRAGGIRHRLLGGEGLRRDTEKRGFRINHAQHFGEMRAIDIGDEVHGSSRHLIRLQSLRHHHRTKVRTADADIDHGGERLARRTLAFARDDRIGERLHTLAHIFDQRHHILAIDEISAIPPVPKSGVKYRAVLRRVDRRTRKHLRATLFEPGFVGQRQKTRHHRTSDAGLR